MRLGPKLAVASFIAAIGVLTECDLAFACSTKDRAYVGLMKSDLRNLVAAETSLRVSTGRFSSNLEELRFKPSPGVTAPVFGVVDASGWAASVRHDVLPTACHVFMGVRPQDAPADLREGEPWCDPYVTEAARRASSAIPTWFGFIVLTIVAAFAFRPGAGRRNWPALAIAILLLVHTMAMFGNTCGPRLDAWSIAPVVAAVLVFIYALQRRMRRT